LGIYAGGMAEQIDEANLVAAAGYSLNEAGINLACCRGGGQVRRNGEVGMAPRECSEYLVGIE